MAQRGRDDIIKVFHLRYAWAEDKTIKFRDKQLTIPGVATLLRNLITGTTAPGQVAENGEKFLVPSLMKLKGATSGIEKNSQRIVHYRFG